MASTLSFIVLLCGLWLVANANVAEEECVVTCPDGWTSFGKHCYVFYHTEKDWADAEHFCTTIGGNLASIHSKGAYAFLRNMILIASGAHKTTWVGGHDAAKESVWLWSDGSKFDYKGWAKGEPNNSGGNENCMQMNFQGKDFVNDIACTTKNSYVCSRHM